MSGHSGDGWRQFTPRFQGAKRKLANVLLDRRREFFLPEQGIFSRGQGFFRRRRECRCSDWFHGNDWICDEKDYHIFSGRERTARIGRF
jgi:hypothetical protein